MRAKPEIPSATLLTGTTIPPQIAQLSVFTLPKQQPIDSNSASFDSPKRKQTQPQSETVFGQSTDQQRDPDYDFLQAQLSPDVLKRKEVKDCEEDALDYSQSDEN